MGASTVSADAKIPAKNADTVDTGRVAPTVAPGMTKERWTAIAKLMEEGAKTGAIEGKDETGKGAMVDRLAVLEP